MKKPNIDEFTDALNKANGNLTDTAQLLQVTRQSIYVWIREDPEFRGAVDDTRKKILDRALDTAKVMAFGIPNVDKEGRLVGWKERPDSNMLRFLIERLGRDEGFGKTVDVTSAGNALPTVINLIKDDHPLNE